MSRQRASLAELCNIQSGGTPLRTNPKFYGGGIPWAKIGDLSSVTGQVSTTEETLTEEGLAAIGGRLFQSGTLLFAIYGSIGKMAFCRQPTATNQAILGINIRDPNRLSERFLYHCLLGKQSQFLGDGQGIAQKNLSAGYLRELSIPLPPIDEQRRIAAILDKADALRRKRKRALDLLDGLTQSIFLEMFGQPGQSKSTVEQRPLSDLAELINGDRSSNYPSGDDLVDSGILFLNTSTITRNGIDTSRANYITDEKFASLTQGKVKDQDIIITLRGSLGLTALFDRAGETAFINAQMMIIRPRKIVDARYLLQALQLDTVRLHFKKIGSGSAVPQLTGKQMKELLIPLPSLELQKEFFNIRTRIDPLQRAAVQSIQGSELLFASLQSRAFSGQL